MGAPLTGGTNPFVYGDGVGYGPSFVGRAGEVQTSFDLLATRAVRFVLVDGTRRSGKTSVVQRIVMNWKEDPPPGAERAAATSVIRVDGLSEDPGRALREVATRLREALSEALGGAVPAPPAQLMGLGGASATAEWLRAAFPGQEAPPLLVALDEVTLVPRRDRRQRAQDELLRWLDLLIAEGVDLVVVAATNGRVKPVGVECSPLLRMAHLLPPLGPLTLGDIRDLVEVGGEDIEFSPDALAVLHDRSGGYPPVVQATLWRLWERFAGKVSPGFLVGGDDVAASMREAEGFARGHIEATYQSMPPMCRLLVSAAAAVDDPRGEITWASPEELTASLGALPPPLRLYRVSDTDVRIAVDTLLHYGVCRGAAADRITLVNAPLARWARSTRAPADAIAVLWAEDLTGFDRGDLIERLRADPNQVNARRLLAQKVELEGRRACAEFLRTCPMTRAESELDALVRELELVALDASAPARVDGLRRREASLFGAPALLRQVRAMLLEARIGVIAASTTEGAAEPLSEAHRAAVEAQQGREAPDAPANLIRGLADWLAADAARLTLLAEVAVQKPIRLALARHDRKQVRLERPDLQGSFRLAVAGGLPAGAENIARCLADAIRGLARRSTGGVEVELVSGFAQAGHRDVVDLFGSDGGRLVSELAPALVSPVVTRDGDTPARIAGLHAVVLLGGRGGVERSRLYRAAVRSGVPVLPVGLPGSGRRLEQAAREGALPVHAPGSEVIWQEIDRWRDHPTRLALSTWLVSRLRELPDTALQTDPELSAIELRRCLRAAVTYQPVPLTWPERLRRMDRTAAGALAGVAMGLMLASGAVTWAAAERTNRPALNEVGVLRAALDDARRAEERSYSGILEVLRDGWPTHDEGADAEVTECENLAWRRALARAEEESAWSPDVIPEELELDVYAILPTVQGAALKVTVLSRTDWLGGTVPGDTYLVSGQSGGVGGARPAVACYAVDLDASGVAVGAPRRVCSRSQGSGRNDAFCASDVWTTPPPTAEAPERVILCVTAYSGASDDALEGAVYTVPGCGAGKDDRLETFSLPGAPWDAFPSRASLHIGLPRDRAEQPKLFAAIPTPGDPAAPVSALRRFASAPEFLGKFLALERGGAHFRVDGWWGPIREELHSDSQFRVALASLWPNPTADDGISAGLEWYRLDALPSVVVERRAMLGQRSAAEQTRRARAPREPGAPEGTPPPPELGYDLIAFIYMPPSGTEPAAPP